MKIKDLTKKIVAFRDARDWAQFHTPKDVALSLLIEAGEYAQLLQFKTETQLAKFSSADKKNCGRELADVLYWVLLAAHENGVDLEKAFVEKMKENEKKYPSKTFRGSNKKYR